MRSSVLLMLLAFGRGQNEANAANDIKNFKPLEGPCMSVDARVDSQDRKDFCFDVAQCAAAGRAAREKSKDTREPKYALVLTHTLENNNAARFRPEQFWSVTAWQRKGVESVMVIPGCPPEGMPKGPISSSNRWCNLESQNMTVTQYRPANSYMTDWKEKGIYGSKRQVRGFHMLLPLERALFERHNITLLEVPWMLPPGLTEWAGGCAMKDLIRLHVFNMTNYDAVVYIDTDINIVGDVVPLLECAATGEFMMTQGLHAPLNAGVMALKPNEELLKLSMWFAERASFSQHPEDITNNKGGWDGGGAFPAGNGWPYFGFECGQGYLWTLFYGCSKGTKHSDSEHVRVGNAMFPLALPYPARLIDRCEYNYQREGLELSKRHCKKAFKCTDVVFLHKAHTKEVAEKYGEESVCYMPIFEPTH